MSCKSYIDGTNKMHLIVDEAQQKKKFSFTVGENSCGKNFINLKVQAVNMQLTIITQTQSNSCDHFWKIKMEQNCDIHVEIDMNNLGNNCLNITIGNFEELEKKDSSPSHSCSYVPNHHRSNFYSSYTSYQDMPPYMCK